MKQLVTDKLRELVGQPSLDAYVARVHGRLGALPQEIRFIAREESSAAVFESISDATAFLDGPSFDFARSSQSFHYQIVYSDLTDFERSVASLDELKDLHRQIEVLAQHAASLSG